jgi:hypothetical protein
MKCQEGTNRNTRISKNDRQNILLRVTKIVESRQGKQRAERGLLSTKNQAEVRKAAVVVANLRAIAHHAKAERRAEADSRVLPRSKSQIAIS